MGSWGRGPIHQAIAAYFWHITVTKAMARLAERDSGLYRPEREEEVTDKLYKKYIIEKSDGTPVDPENEYFVLNLTTDPKARSAAMLYAVLAALDGQPGLSSDLARQVILLRGHDEDQKLELKVTDLRERVTELVSYNDDGALAVVATFWDDEDRPEHLRGPFLCTLLVSILQDNFLKGVLSDNSSD